MTKTVRLSLNMASEAGVDVVVMLGPLTGGTKPLDRYLCGDQAAHQLII